MPSSVHARRVEIALAERQHHARHAPTNSVAGAAAALGRQQPRPPPSGRGKTRTRERSCSASRVRHGCRALALETLVCHRERLLGAAAQVQDVGVVDAGAAYLSGVRPRARSRGPRAARRPSSMSPRMPSAVPSTFNARASASRAPPRARDLERLARDSMASPKRDWSIRSGQLGQQGGAFARLLVLRRAAPAPGRSCRRSSCRFRLHSAARGARACRRAARLGDLVRPARARAAAAPPGAQGRPPGRRRFAARRSRSTWLDPGACSGSGTRSQSPSARSSSDRASPNALHTLGGRRRAHRRGQRAPAGRRRRASGARPPRSGARRRRVLERARSSARASAPCSSARSPGSRSS